MPLEKYDGPKANHVAILGAIVGETITASFFDASGRIWLLVKSGHALRFSGLDISSPGFEVIDPTTTRQEVEKFQNLLRTKIAEVRALAPGVPGL